VEVPCLVDGGGIVPGRIENYPEQLAALNRGMINLQMLAAEGALKGDRRRIFQAIAVDPLTAAVCSLDEIQTMTDELFAALQDQLAPEFFN
jgi:alpha-galactosidase